MPIPERGLPPDEVRALLHKRRAEDVPFATGRALGSMCTEPHPLAREAADLFREANLGDPALAPGAAALEEELLAWVGELVQLPTAGQGLVTSGGSEANLLALRMARDTTGRDRILVPETGHFSLDKAAGFLGLRLTRVPVHHDTFTTDLSALEASMTDDVAAVVSVAGTTEFGTVDPTSDVARIAKEWGAWCHVDAAYGGLMIPFLPGLAPFGFDVPGVDSVAVDLHKMGRAVIPCGALFVRDRAAVDRVATQTRYVSVDKQATVTGTRPGYAPAAAWAALAALGREGLAAQARQSVELARWLAGAARGRGLNPIDPVLGIVALRLADPDRAWRRLVQRGYVVNRTTLVPGLRVVTMPHVKKEHLERFLTVLREVVA